MKNSTSCPSTRLSLPKRAFKGCTSLNHAIGRYGSGWTIGDSAFENSSLPGIYTNCLSDLGKSAFRKCTGLDSGNVIGGTLTEIKDSTFASCVNLKELRLLDGCKITSIGNWAFYNDYSLTTVGSTSGTVSFPDATIVRQHALYGCECIEILDLPKVTTLYQSACQHLASCSINVPALKSCVGNYNFGHLESDDLDLPSIESLARFAFGYSKIKNVRLGSGLTYFPAYVFTDCFFEMERNLYFQGTTPPQIDALAFITDYEAQSQVVNFTKIHVPSGCKDAYVNAITSANSLYAQYASIIVDDL